LAALPVSAGPPIRVAGSDTMRPLLEAWADSWRQEHPGAVFEIEASGSRTGPPALTEGRADIASLSRPMTREEREAFQHKHGHRPVALRVAADAVVVYVHRDNPINGLTLQQLDGMFSADGRCGGMDITGWGQILFGSLSEQTIDLVGRNPLSGTHEFFKSRVLCDGEFRPDVLERADSEAVVAAVAGSPRAIGYAGLAFGTPNVKAVALAEDEDEPYVRFGPERDLDHPEPARRYRYVLSGRYPLARHLYFYVNKPPGDTLARDLQRPLEYLLSAEGQKVVAAAGFVPLLAEELERQRERLERGYRPRWWSRE
jgi:phosphate transport system substrate-binding protein